MLPSLNEYKKLIHKESLLTDEEMKKATIFEDYIKRSMERVQYISMENLDIVENYEKEISSLKEKKEKNENEKLALKRGQEILLTKSFEEQKLEERERQEILRQKKAQSAGYLNGGILIYITINLGLMVAGLILIILK